MTFDKAVMEKFMADHQSQYVGKYRYHSGYRTEEHTFKVHYYMLDQNFRQIDIFVEIHCQDEITYTFSEDLHEQEKLYIVKDALSRILAKLGYKRVLHYSLYENFIKTVSSELNILAPIDFCDILSYMKYHHGINQQTMDDFYKIFLPCLKMNLKHKNYKNFIDSLNLLFESVLYQYEWDGTNSKYLDTEYQYHLYYIRKIIRIVYRHLDKFYKNVPDELFKAIRTLCLNSRFTFAIMTDFGSMVLSQYHVTKAIIDTFKDEFTLIEKDFILVDKKKDENQGNLVFSYIYYIFYSDYDHYYEVLMNVLRNIIHYMLTFANHDLDLALGNSIIQAEGYQILLDLFHRDYNTFVFTCFPIESFPDNMKPKVRDELVTAIQYFAARMENESYRLSSFEQVTNINRLLMDNFKEWYK